MTRGQWWRDRICALEEGDLDLNLNDIFRLDLGGRVSLGITPAIRWSPTRISYI